METRKRKRTETSENVIILDWDDTLFPSAFCRDNPQVLSVSTAVETKMLAELDAKVAALLEEADKKGSVFIVTAADSCWVSWSAARVLPTVSATLTRLDIHILSARMLFGSPADQVDPQVADDTVVQWKSSTFRLLVEPFMDQKFDRINVLTAGDAPTDHRASEQCFESFSLQDRAKLSWQHIQTLLPPVPPNFLSAQSDLLRKRFATSDATADRGTFRSVVVK